MKLLLRLVFALLSCMAIAVIGSPAETRPTGGYLPITHVAPPDATRLAPSYIYKFELPFRFASPWMQQSGFEFTTSMIKYRRVNTNDPWVPVSKYSEEFTPGENEASFVAEAEMAAQQTYEVRAEGFQIDPFGEYEQWDHSWSVRAP